jgi:hypothetical protein
VDEYKMRPAALAHLAPYLYCAAVLCTTARAAQRSQRRGRRRARRRGEPAAGAAGAGGADDSGAASSGSSSDAGSVDSDGGARAEAGGAGRRRPSFPLAPEHPKHGTHVLVLRRRPVVPQLLGSFPAEPAADASDADREAFAAWYLGTFWTDQVWGSLAEGETLWALLQRAPPLSPTLARVMARVQAAAAARRERVSRAQLRHEHLRAAGAAGPAGGRPRRRGDAWGDDSDGEGASGEDSDPGGDFHALGEADIAALLEQQDAVGATATDEARYKDAALRSLDAIEAADLRHLPLPDSAALAAWPAAPAERNALIKGLASAANAAKAFRAEVDNTGEEGGAAPRLRVRAPPSNPELLVLERETHGTWMQLERGSLPPFQRCATAPDAAATAALMGLDPYQTFSFRLFAGHLDANLAGDNPPQLRAIVQGRPGAGKSRMMWAFLWYAFQRGAANKVRVATYTWRAAKQASGQDCWGEGRNSHCLGLVQRGEGGGVVVTTPTDPRALKLCRPSPQVSTPVTQATSTMYLWGLDAAGQHVREGDVAAMLETTEYMGLDERSFIGAQHFFKGHRRLTDCARNAGKAVRQGGPPKSEATVNFKDRIGCYRCWNLPHASKAF